MVIPRPKVEFKITPETPNGFGNTQNDENDKKQFILPDTKGKYLYNMSSVLFK